MTEQETTQPQTQEQPMTEPTPAGGAMTEQDIFGKLLPLVREVTGAPAARVTMQAGLMEDLGAESIDLLDLSFLIEEAFGVTLEADEFERHATGRMGGRPYERDGVLTEEALAQLRSALPEVPPDKLRPGLRKIELPSVLNVAVFVHLIQRKLAARPQALGAPYGEVADA